MTNKIFNLFKIFWYLLKLKTNDVRNIILKYPEYIFFNSSEDKNEILRGFYNELPFNGQKKRKELVESLIKNFNPDMLVETGTYLGNTLQYLLNFDIPTYSVEINEKFYFIAKSRFLDKKNLLLNHGDSVSFLKSLDKTQKKAFIYLDAHWYSDLPLNEELIHIEKFESAIVLIDDFKIPNDSRWKYDNYGNTDLRIENVNFSDKFKKYFPNYSPIQDGGFMTGCLVLGKGEEAIQILKNSNLLDEFVS
tara:strand:- start:1653 stop:2399 length:747 start_codon:yes stop_codon:yes gene_type:complete